MVFQKGRKKSGGRKKGTSNKVTESIKNALNVLLPEDELVELWKGFLYHDDSDSSSVRNMIRRGVPQKTAREISGHKTDAVFSRYNIVSGADIADAARKIEEGAKAALKGSIHSSFIVEPQSEAASEEEATRKPS